MRPIDADALKEHKFVGNQFIQIGGRTNGKTLEAVNKAYQQGWNDAIDAVVDNSPTIDDLSEYSDKLWQKAYERGKAKAITNEDIKNAIHEGFKNGYEMAKAKFERPTGKWETPFEVYGKTYHKCTHCHISSELILIDKYCPNCGAKMTKEAENEI